MKLYGLKKKDWTNEQRRWNMQSRCHYLLNRTSVFTGTVPMGNRGWAGPHHTGRMLALCQALCQAKVGLHPGRQSFWFLKVVSEDRLWIESTHPLALCLVLPKPRGCHSGKEGKVYWVCACVFKTGILAVTVSPVTNESEAINSRMSFKTASKPNNDW